MPTPLDILVVDDEPSILVCVGDALRASGYRVVEANDGAAAMDALACQVFDLVVCDVRLPRYDGLAILQRVREEQPTTDVILMTAYAAVPDAVAALKAGATDYLTKPFTVQELMLRIERAARERALKRELENARTWLEEASDGPALVGRSPAMLRLFQRIEKFGASDAPTLIAGESGTGKELVAAALHLHSPRRDRPFVAVNCAAFPETLLEAELFGHERGAFTGAVKKRDGRFKAADGGTLLLDEVAETPLPAQAKLLRVLQEKSFEPLGTNESVRVDVRVLSATHRNLREMVAKGAFREDLYYRLKILELDVPPLRERQGDLPVLLQFFLRRFSPKNGQVGITSRAMATLSAYTFPGNVRELEHAIRHAVAMTGGAEDIDLFHLPSDIVGRSIDVEAAASGIRPLPDAMREFEREYLSRALRAGAGSKTQTAAALGISRKNLWEKLKRHGLESPIEDEEVTGVHPEVTDWAGGPKKPHRPN
jgi:two-component system response regulator AtoC